MSKAAPIVADGEAIDGLVERLFRRESSRIVAALTRLIGAGRLDLAEDVAQETLARALRHWPWSGVPDDPVGWLYAVARRVAVDAARHDATLARKAEQIGRELFAEVAAAPEPAYTR